jgi:2TM domain
MVMPTELLTKNEHKPTAIVPAVMTEEDHLRIWAREHVDRVRRLKFHVAAYLLGMALLTPIWLLIEWQDNGAFERWSSNSNPGDWEPWIIYPAIGWGLFVLIKALQTYFDRPTTEAEVDRQLEKLARR